MRRIDRSVGGATTDLPSAVGDMRSAIYGSRAAADRRDVLSRIDSYQTNPGNLAFSNYRSGIRVGWNPRSSLETSEQRIDRLIRTIDNNPGMPPGGLAYLGIHINGASTASVNYGHAMLMQRLPDARNGSERYAIFDPNNGAFTYDSLQATVSSPTGLYEFSLQPRRTQRGAGYAPILCVPVTFDSVFSKTRDRG